MRIFCDGCGAKYQVADEKVQNRSFKFPCKKCGAKIIVRQDSEPKRDEPLTAESASDGEAFEPTKQLAYDDHLARQALEEGAVWYVAVGKERVGPISADEVQSYINQGKVTAASFVWCDGMDNWASLDSVPALSRLLPDEDSVAATNPFAEAEPTGVGHQEAPVEEHDGEDLFVSEKREATLDEPVGSPIVGAGQLTGQRHENSVLFSLDSLDNDTSASKSGMLQPSATGNTEASGLIDLAMLAGESGTSNPIFSQTGSGIAPIGAPIKPMASLVTQPRQSSLGLIIGAVAVLVAALTGAAVWFVLKQNEVPVNSTAVAPPTPVNSAEKVAVKPATPTATPEKVQPTQEAETVETADANKAEKTDSEPKSGDTKTTSVSDNAAAKSSPTTKTVTKATAVTRRKSRPKSVRSSRPSKPVAATPAPLPLPTPKPATKRKAKASGDAAALLASLDGGGSTKKSPTRGGGSLPSLDAPAVDPTLPERLDRGQVLRAIRRHFSKVKDCRRLEPDITGQVTVKFTVNGNGRVSGAKTTGQYANTPIGDCVSQKVQAIRFPRFSGSPFPITFPFSL